jgi:hypothetical protein
MADTLPISPVLPGNADLPIGRPHLAERVSTRTASIPWYIWCNVIAVFSGVVGLVWDISWHESIGRDSFWTPAHILIQLSAILAGIACAYLIFSTTFQPDSPLRANSISIWGFRGPLGAFVCAWGGVCMITSAPFDNFWHNAYGLDVKILSPPHILLALGILGLRFGTLVLVLAETNRATGRYRARLEWLLLFCFMFLMALTIGVMQEDTLRIFMHGAKFYLVVMGAVPLWFAAVSRVSENRWAATIMTACFTATHLCFMWILQLVPAEPKLGPVYQKITHLVPPDFPLLLIVPAIVFDLLRRLIANWNRFAQAVVLGAACLASFFAVQWPFASFLMSPASRNWFFATNNAPYFIPPSSHWANFAWLPTESTGTQFVIVMCYALVAAVLTIALGFAWGNWMRHLRR